MYASAKKREQSSFMIKKEKLVSAGPEKLADILLSIYEENNDLHTQMDIIFAELNQDPKKMISLIKKEISSIKSSTEFIDYYGSDFFASKMHQLRIRIVEDVLPKSPQSAIELMQTFLDLHKTTMERVDDGYALSSVFMEACVDLGTMHGHIERPVEEIVELVFNNFMVNEHCIYDEIIQNFKEPLTDVGLDMLLLKFQNAINQKNGYVVIQAFQAIADSKQSMLPTDKSI